jgi:hypothetical protein
MCPSSNAGVDPSVERGNMQFNTSSSLCVSMNIVNLFEGGIQMCIAECLDLRKTSVATTTYKPCKFHSQTGAGNY